MFGPIPVSVPGTVETIINNPPETGQSRYNTLFIMNISILDDKGKGRCASVENWLF